MRPTEPTITDATKKTSLQVVSGWNHEGRFKEKSCRTCGEMFKPKSGGHLYCSPACGFESAKKHTKTEAQYELISGNWSRYLSRLRYSAGRKRALSRDELLEVLEKQNYKCALSGVEMTCQLNVGERYWTNASIDRIEAGGPYTKENIQLVCRGLNSWRSAIPIDEFVWWCQQVVNFQRENGGQDGQA